MAVAVTTSAPFGLMPVDGVIAALRGVCQDFAVSSSRCAGCVARRRGNVSGWMFEADRDGPVDGHAWAEVDIPGVGRVEEDPTHVGEASDAMCASQADETRSDVVPIMGRASAG